MDYIVPGRGNVRWTVLSKCKIVLDCMLAAHFDPIEPKGWEGVGCGFQCSVVADDGIRAGIDVKLEDFAKSIIPKQYGPLL